MAGLGAGVGGKWGAVSELFQKHRNRNAGNREARMVGSVRWKDRGQIRQDLAGHFAGFRLNAVNQKLDAHWKEPSGYNILVHQNTG